MDVLRVAEAFVNEENYIVWSDLSQNLFPIVNALQYTDAVEAYQAYAKALFGPVARKLGWEAKENESRK